MRKNLQGQKKGLIHRSRVEKPGLLRLFQGKPGLLRGVEKPGLLQLLRGVEKPGLLRVRRGFEKPGLLRLRQGAAPRRTNTKRSSTLSTAGSAVFS